MDTRIVLRPTNARKQTVPSDFFHSVADRAKEGHSINHPFDYLVISRPIEFYVRFANELPERESN